MNTIFHRLKQGTAEALGLDRMSKSYHILITNYIFLMFYGTLEGVFINTLLYRISGGDMLTVIIYRAITYIASAAFFHVGALISQKKSPVLTARLGACFFLMTYIMLFIFMEHMGNIYILIAIFSGGGGGLYWAGHNILVPNYTTKDNRDTGISILGMVQGVLTLTVPLISGFVISFMPEISGYRVLFGTAMAAVAVQLFVMSKFHPVPKNKNKSEIMLAIRLIIRRSSYKLMLGFEMIRGIRDGTFAFILNMLLFEIITDERVVGVNTFLTGVLAITGSWAYGKLVTPKTRVKYAMLGTTTLMGVCALLFLNVSVTTVMIFAAVNAFMQVTMLYSYSNTTYDTMAQNNVSRKCMSEMFAFRETAITLGRLLGLWLTTLVPSNNTGYVVVMLLLTVSQFIAIGLMQAAIKKPSNPVR